MQKVFTKFRRELHALIPPTIFFFIALHIVALMRSLMLKGTGITTQTSMSVALASIILAKAVLIADLMPFMNRYPNKPLIYNVVWKSTIYILLSMFIHYTEILFDLWLKNHNLVFSYKEMITRIVWPHFLAIQILLSVLIFMYCASRELIRIIGPSKVQRIFFGPT